MKFENLKAGIDYLLKCRFCGANTEIDGVLIKNDKFLIIQKDLLDIKIAINMKTNKQIVNNLQKDFCLNREDCKKCNSRAGIIINEKLETQIYSEYFCFEFEDKYHHFFFNTYSNELILEIHGKDYTFKSFNLPIINFIFENKNEVINKINMLKTFQ
jgi:hypothetical protein